MKRKFILLLSVFYLICSLAYIPPPVILPEHKLKKIDSIDLPGPVGKRFGCLTIDYIHNYLFVAHTDADVLYVIDLKTNKLVKMIKDTPGVTGIEYVPELNKVYTSNSRDCTIGVINMNTFEVIKKIPTTWKPNGSTYAPDFKKLYVSDELSKTLLVIDVVKDEVIKKITFNSKTGTPKYDSIAKKIYLNLPDKNKFAVIDPIRDTLIALYGFAQDNAQYFSTDDCPHNCGIDVDVKNHMAFLGCANGNIAFFDLQRHRLHTALGIGGIPDGGDAIKYDPGFKRIYVACNNGVISIISTNRDAKILDPLQLEDVPVYKKIHSLTVDINTHRVYAPEQEENGKAVSRVIVYDAVP